MRLFVSSFSPLFGILAIRFRSPRLQIACGLLAAFGVITLAMLLKQAARISTDPHRLETVADRGPEVAGYLATYLLPFVTVAHPSARDVVAYAAFLLIVGIVYVRSDMLQVNPLLYVLRYRVWAVRTTDGWDGYLVSRGRPKPGDVVLASRLQNTLAFEQ
jgi:hypothetical protein